MYRFCLFLVGLAMASAFLPTRFGARCSTELQASHGMKNRRQLGHYIKVQLDTARDEAKWEKSKEEWAASGKKELDEKKSAAKKAAAVPVSAPVVPELDVVEPVAEVEAVAEAPAEASA